MHVESLASLICCSPAAQERKYAFYGYAPAVRPPRHPFATSKALIWELETKGDDFKAGSALHEVSIAFADFSSF